MGVTIAEKERNARITTRVPENVHNLLSEAASLVGSTLNQFVVQSALEKANRIIEHERFVYLADQASKKFIDALGHPPQPNDKLKEAFRTHREQL
ncbi:MAG: DUF1778 domain-containing protein [Thermodesulfobacteriota bacterium]|nr:DUF1778 domain-containing protein [Thermodesulfobacteriota bacterium]